VDRIWINVEGRAEASEQNLPGKKERKGGTMESLHRDGALKPTRTCRVARPPGDTTNMKSGILSPISLYRPLDYKPARLQSECGTLY
jgi:hypothetical protein